MIKFLSKIRLWIAFASAAIIHLGIFGIKARGLQCPAYSCNGCPWASFACPVGVSAYQSALGRFPAAALSFLILTGILVGRLVCGFLCPMGLIQDLVHRIPSPRCHLPRWTRYLKYGVLVFLVFLFPYLMGVGVSGYLKLTGAEIIAEDNELKAVIQVLNISKKEISSPVLSLSFKEEGLDETMTRTFDGIKIAPGESRTLPGVTLPEGLTMDTLISISSPQTSPRQSIPVSYLYFCKLCPFGTLTAALPAYLAPGGAAVPSIYRWQTARFVILLALLVLTVFVSRPFCQSLCPLGALYALLNRFTLFGINFDRSRCIDCRACSKVCPMDLDVTKEAGGPECIECGDCIKSCPKNALRRTMTLKK